MLCIDACSIPDFLAAEILGESSSPVPRSKNFQYHRMPTIRLFAARVSGLDAEVDEIPVMHEARHVEGFECVRTKISTVLLRGNDWGFVPKLARLISPSKRQ